MTRDESACHAQADSLDPEGPWAFRLYVAGRTPRASLALENLKRLCEQNLTGRYRIEVIDLRQQPEAAFADQVLAIPTVVRKSPAPDRRVVGDLSNVAKVLRALQIEPRPAA